MGTARLWDDPQTSLGAVPGRLQVSPEALGPVPLATKQVPGAESPLPVWRSLHCDLALGVSWQRLGSSFLPCELTEVQGARRMCPWPDPFRGA